MRAIDTAMLLLISLSLSLGAATAFLLWLAAQRGDIGFSPSLALSGLIGFVLPLAGVAALRRVKPGLHPGWSYAFFMLTCTVIALAFAAGLR